MKYKSDLLIFKLFRLQRFPIDFLSSIWIFLTRPQKWYLIISRLLHNIDSRICSPLFFSNILTLARSIENTLPNVKIKKTATAKMGSDGGGVCACASAGHGTSCIIICCSQLVRSWSHEAIWLASPTVVPRSVTRSLAARCPPDDRWYFYSFHHTPKEARTWSLALWGISALKSSKWSLYPCRNMLVKKKKFR